MSQEPAPGRGSGQRGTPPDPVEPSEMPTRETRLDDPRPSQTPLDATLTGETPTARIPAVGRPADESEVPLTFGPTVTIFFSDIRGFTEYTEAHGDAAAYRMLQHHNAMVQEQIALYGGHIVKTLGDSYMVSFDAARNAMTCGIGIQKSLARYNGEREGTTIDIGIGINTGEPIREAEDFFGGSVNLAARICAAAGPGQILVSEAARHVVGKMEGTEYIDRGFFELKGFHQPQHLYEVDWSGLGTSVSAPPSRATSAPPVRLPGQPAEGSAATPAPRASRRGPLIAVAAVAAVLVVAAGGFFLLRGRAAPSVAEEMTSKPQAGQGASVAAKPGAPSPSVAKPAVASPAAATGPAAASSPVTIASPVAVASPGMAAGGRRLQADDFSDPARGQFANNQQGTLRVTVAGSPVEYQWSYAYQGGAMVARLTGDYPANPGPDQLPFVRAITSTDKVFEDFAVEVYGRIAQSPAQTRFGIQYAAAQNDNYNVTLNPMASTYAINHTLNGQQIQMLAARRTTAMKPADQDNSLRFEVRGDTAKLFINGQQVDQVQHEGLARRNGQVSLLVLGVGPLTNRTSEVQFDDFKLFSLAP